MSDLLAGRRDASWYKYPGYAPTYHVDVEGSPACNRKTALLMPETYMPAERVEVDRRCARPGCSRRWPPFKKCRGKS